MERIRIPAANDPSVIRQIQKSREWIGQHIRNVPVKEHHHSPQTVIVIADVTFFKRSFGILVIRASHLKKNLYTREVKSESIDAYRQG